MPKTGRIVDMELNRIPTETSTVNQYAPSLSLFAQLLAAERLTLAVSDGAQTASFSPANRVLTIPSWKGWSEAAWLFFVAHEVGHALWTPAAYDKTPTWLTLVKQYGTGVVHMLTNLIEDIRIERLVRVKYRGLGGVFSRGYLSLLEKDFFGWGERGLTDAKWLKLSPLDRLNIYAKVGGLKRVSLITANEIVWYNRAASAQTFAEVMGIVADILSTLTKEQQEKLAEQGQGQQSAPQQGEQSGPKQQGEQSGPKQQGEKQTSDSGKGEKQESKDESDKGAKQDEQSKGTGAGDTQDSDEQDGDKGDDSGKGDEAGDDTGDESGDKSGDDDKDGDAGDDASKGAGDTENDAKGSGDDTDGDATDDAQESDESGQGQRTPTTDPADLLKMESVENAAKALKNSLRGPGAERGAFPMDTTHLHYNDVELAEWLENWEARPAERELIATIVDGHRREAGAVLASMIAMFRMNQSAWCQRRAIISRSGMLDPNKLSAYKLTEDLFLRRRDVPEAQNHGFVLHVDWSGSMQSKMSSVLWQVMHLIWFADAIKVPVKVYGFNTGKGQESKGYKDYVASGKIRPTTNRLLCIYDSSATARMKRDAMAQLFCLILQFAGGESCFTSSKNYMGEVKPNTQKVPPPIAKKLTKMFGMDRSRIFVQHFAGMGSTPLYYCLVSAVDTVRAFRQQNRIEQCVSVWLTDGDDTEKVPLSIPQTQSQNVSDYYYQTNDRRGTELESGAQLFDPRTGKTFTQKGSLTLSMLFEYHKALTGATVICIDITETPIASFRRVVTGANLAVIGGMIGKSAQRSAPTPSVSSDPYSGGGWRRGRFRRASRMAVRARLAVKKNTVVVKTKVQTKRKVLIQPVKGTFDTTGLMVVNKKQFPELGADAYLVSHPSWWESAVTDAQKAIAKKAAEEIRNERAEWARLDGEQFHHSDYNPVVLSAALIEQQQGSAMRKFTDALVPYMAATLL